MSNDRSSDREKLLFSMLKASVDKNYEGAPDIMFTFLADVMEAGPETPEVRQYIANSFRRLSENSKAAAIALGVSKRGRKKTRASADDDFNYAMTVAKHYRLSGRLTDSSLGEFGGMTLAVNELWPYIGERQFDSKIKRLERAWARYGSMVREAEAKIAAIEAQQQL
jgi:hypothetical protein